MSARYYGLLLGLAASLSLPLAGCSSSPPPNAAGGAAATQQATARDTDDSDATLWTVLGLAKRESARNPGPQTGASVSPELWQASQDTLKFAGISAEDSVTGLLMTKWYSPPGKPDERLRVSVFILSRVLRSDSLAVTVEREVRAPSGQWQKTPVARDVADGLDNAILLRARQIHAENYRNTVYK
ncbi:MAG TPA: DUF3576 domain-containing protein [Stellaceae bacterium]|nr:DUF3576 domain-containing protein [Stellaceae bacterium]